MRVAMLFSVWALSLVHLVHSACSVPGTTTLSNAGDATAIASCKTFSGSIALATDTSDEIALDGPQEITGDLVVQNATQITSFTSDSLQEIEGTFILDNVQTLSTLDFAKLTSIGKLQWTALPNLQEPGFELGISASKVDIQNTLLAQLNLIAATQIVISNNPFMRNISIALNNVTTSLTVEFNNPEMSLSLPNLYWANNLTFRNIATLNMPLINTVNDSLGFFNCSIGKLEVPNLSSIKGGLATVTNSDLVSIQLPGLVSLGSLQIANNTKLETVAFNQLGVVSGNVSIEGHFSNVTMPELQSADGSFSINPINRSFNCDTFDSYRTSSVIKGAYQCNGTHSNPSASAFNSAIASATSSNQPVGSTSANSSSSAGLSTGTKAGIGVGVSLGVLAAASIGAYFLIRRRKQKVKRTLEGTGEKKEAIGELDADAIPRQELSNGREVQELSNGREVQELHAEHGISEAGDFRVYELPGRHEPLS